MSQEKVDRYKQQKKDRKKIMKKEKRIHILGCAAAAVICLGIVGWAGWSGYTVYENNKPVSYTEVNMDAITDYYSSLEVE